jgi:hypothetical protein
MRFIRVPPIQVRGEATAAARLRVAIGTDAGRLALGDGDVFGNRLRPLTADTWFVLKAGLAGRRWLMYRVQGSLLLWAAERRINLVLEHKGQVTLDNFRLFRVERRFFWRCLYLEIALQPVTKIAACHR